MQSQIKALFAKHETLRHSVQGMKTQQGYVREDIKSQGGRLDDLTTLLRVLDIRLFCWQLAFVFVAFLYGTLIIGSIMRGL